MAQPIKKKKIIKKKVSKKYRQKKIIEEQSKEEIGLIKARHEMNEAWRKLDKAITEYNLYLENNRFMV
jgi:hypothetical protein